MIVFETDKLIIKSHLSLENGKFKDTSPKKPIDLARLGDDEEHKKAFCIFLKTNNEEIGAIAFYDKWHENELNVVIHKDENKRKGYMFEALSGLLRYINNKTDYTEVYGVVTTSNEASIGLLKKCGFQQIEESTTSGNYDFVYKIYREEK